jgi:hypothetical protein
MEQRQKPLLPTPPPNNGHRIRQRLATGAWRDFHENKIARLPYVDPSTEYARTLRHLHPGLGREVESREK